MTTLDDHPGPLTALRITADGRTLIAAGGRPGLFGSWIARDVAGWKKRLDVRGHSDAILAVAVAPDGKTLATAGYDRQILIWDLAAGKVVRPLKDHSDAVYGLAFSPDGRTLASCAADRTVKLWDWSAGRRTATLSESTAELYAVAFTPDGSRVLAGGRRSLDPDVAGPGAGGGAAAEPRLERSAFAHDAAILRLAVSADGKLLASSGEDRTVRLWDLADALAPRLAARAGRLGPGAGLLARRQAAGAGPLRRLARPLGCRHHHAAALAEPGAARAAALAAGAANPPAPCSCATPRSTLPSPRGAVRGSKVKVTLTGIGVGRATTVLLPEPGVTAAILPAKAADPNRLEVELTIAPDARLGLRTIGVATPLGVPGLQELPRRRRPRGRRARAERPAGSAPQPAHRAPGHPHRHDRPARRRRPVPLRCQGRAGAGLPGHGRVDSLDAASGADADRPDRPRRGAGRRGPIGLRCH